MLTINVGDKPIVRSWRSMANEFGYRGHDIPVHKGTYFVPGMKSLCGTTLTITRKNSETFKAAEADWYYTTEMFVGG